MSRSQTARSRRRQESSYLEAIRVRVQKTGFDYLYDWGNFDFAEPNFVGTLDSTALDNYNSMSDGWSDEFIGWIAP